MQMHMSKKDSRRGATRCVCLVVLPMSGKVSASFLLTLAKDDCLTEHTKKGDTMSEISNLTSDFKNEALKQRVVNILNDKCTTCPLVRRLISRAVIDDGVIHEGLFGMERLGGLLGSAIATISPEACNESNCLTADQDVQLAETVYQLPYDGDAAKLVGQMAIDRGLVSSPSDFDSRDY